MFDILADQTEKCGSVCRADDFGLDVVAQAPDIDTMDTAVPSFRTINVLVIDTGNGSGSESGEHAGRSSIIEQCLRYMTRFECRIAQAGSHAAAQFALRSDSFDLVIADGRCLDLVAANEAVPTIVVAARPGSEITRQALKAGASYCLPLNDLSPRLLETAISQMLSDEAALA
jgi:hypothetical protein